jgi:hypothetical protein
LGSDNIGKKRRVPLGRRGLRQQRIELVELRFLRVTVRKSGGAFELSDDRIKGAIRVLGRAEITEPRVWLGREALHERGGEPGFADAGLTGQQHHLAFASLRFRPAPHEQFKLFFPPDECSKDAGVHRLEAARDRTCPRHRERSHRPGDPLEVLWPKVPQLEESAHQPPGRLGNDNRVRLGDGLKARCRRERDFCGRRQAPQTCLRDDTLAQRHKSRRHRSRKTGRKWAFPQAGPPRRVSVDWMVGESGLEPGTH